MQEGQGLKQKSPKKSRPDRAAFFMHCGAERFSVTQSANTESPEARSETRS
jgi:hypothetical protein